MSRLPSPDGLLLAWAMMQNELGTASGRLGERGTACLGQVAEALRAALLEHTRERVPLNWGTLIR